MKPTPRSNRAALESIHLMNGGVLRECKAMEIELEAAKQRIKRLEEAGDAMVNEGWNEPHLAEAWRKAKEDKL